MTEGYREAHDIDLSLILQTVRSHYLHLLVAAILFGGLTFAVMHFVPKHYRSDHVSIMESRTSTVANGIHAVGTTLGYELGEVPTNSDAIVYKHYSDLMRSPQFMGGVMRTVVTLSDGTRMRYFDYLRTRPKGLFGLNLFRGAEPDGKDVKQVDFDEFNLTPEQEELFAKASNDVYCSFNLSSVQMYVTVRDEDPMVCATLSDSVAHRIQSFIFDYRLEKARRNVAYYESQVAIAEKNYRKAMDAYDAYSASHHDVTSPAVMSRMEMLEREAGDKHTILEAIQAQCFAEKAKLQDHTPLFHTVENPRVAGRPEGPNTRYYTMLMTLVGALLALLWCLRRDLYGQLAS